VTYHFIKFLNTGFIRKLFSVSLPVATFTTGALLPGCKKNNSLAGNYSIAKYTVSFRNSGSSAGPATIMYDQEGRVTKLSHAQQTYRVEFDHSSGQ